MEYKVNPLIVASGRYPDKSIDELCYVDRDSKKEFLPELDRLITQNLTLMNWIVTRATELDPTLRLNLNPTIELHMIHLEGIFVPHVVCQINDGMGKPYVHSISSNGPLGTYPTADIMCFGDIRDFAVMGNHTVGMFPLFNSLYEMEDFINSGGYLEELRKKELFEKLTSS